jgi:hypothetical protein
VSDTLWLKRTHHPGRVAVGVDAEMIADSRFGVSSLPKNSSRFDRVRASVDDSAVIQRQSLEDGRGDCT